MLRTHNCGELNRKHLESEVTLCGWVAKVRDHGGVNFVDLRDRWGVTQVVFHPEADAKLTAAAKDLRAEFCVAVRGVVKPRPKGTENTRIPTGEVEIAAQSVTVFSKSLTPPFELASEETGEEVRLKHRYIDLRRAPMQEALLFRSRLAHEMRQYFHRADFIEVETPVLTKSTPEGARDYLVPSRVNPGQFFALPQSPQLFKQLLMVSGFDRYFQIAKCFRDEDLRADRQPEFTQLDIEMSFVTKEDIFALLEGLFAHLLRAMKGIEIKVPFRRLNYQDAMRLYGTDKPDLRFGLEIRDVSAVFRESSFKIFRSAVDGGGCVLALAAPEAAGFERKDFGEMEEFAKSSGAAGLAYLKFAGGAVESPIAKFMSEKELAGLRAAFGAAGEKSAAFFAAGKPAAAQKLLGAVRLKLADKLALIKPGEFSFLWVDEFPLFHLNEEEKRWDSEHHPFTGPHPEDLALLGKDNGRIRSLSYDLVLNGNEIASGSVRIHDAEVQKKIFEIIGINAEEAERRFGFLLSAFRYGPPPHGGIAVGVDRLVTILLGRESIREVVAFPKTQKAVCPLTEAPSPVNPAQLKELGIKVL